MVYILSDENQREFEETPELARFALAGYPRLRLSALGSVFGGATLWSRRGPSLPVVLYEVRMLSKAVADSGTTSEECTSPRSL